MISEHFKSIFIKSQLNDSDVKVTVVFLDLSVYCMWFVPKFHRMVKGLTKNRTARTARTARTTNIIFMSECHYLYFLFGDFLYLEPCN